MSHKGILFDLDNTLYEYAPCDESGLEAAWHTFAASIPLSQERFREVHDAIRDRWAATLSGQAASHNRGLFFKAIVETVSGRSQSKLAIQLHDAYWRSFHDRMSLNADARGLLAGLEERDYRLALVSNHVALPQLGKVNALGIESHFPVIVTSEEAGVEKPHRRIFALAFERLQIEAEDAIFVGDDARTDMAGASSVGMTTIQMLEYSDICEADSCADHAVSRLGDVLGIVLELAETP